MGVPRRSTIIAPETGKSTGAFSSTRLSMTRRWRKKSSAAWLIIKYGHLRLQANDFFHTYMGKSR